MRADDIDSLMRQGFRHLTLYLRGREELLLTVLNNPSPAPTPPSGGNRCLNLHALLVDLHFLIVSRMFSSPAASVWMSASPSAAAAALAKGKEENQKSNLCGTPSGPPPASPAVNEGTQALTV